MPYIIELQKFLKNINNIKQYAFNAAKIDISQQHKWYCEYLFDDEYFLCTVAVLPNYGKSDTEILIDITYETLEGLFLE